MCKQFSKFKPFCTAFGLEWQFLGRRPKPALLFLIAEKDPAGRFAKRLAPEPPSAGQIYFYPGILQPFYQGLHPLPALLFFIAKKVSKKASPLGTYKTYFEPGVLQLPTVGQIKRLYNSVQNRFYKQVQKGAFNGEQQQLNGTQQQQRQQQKT